MAIENYTQQLRQQLDNELSLINLQGRDKLIQLESAFQQAEKILEELNVFVCGYQFESTAEEIHFFKRIKPQFQSESIYYAELFILESNRPLTGKQTQKDYFLEEQRSLKGYMDRHRALHNYMLLDQRHFDAQYFLRRARSDVSMPHGYHSTIDNRCCTVHSIQVSTLQAVLRINAYIQEMLQELDGIKPPEQSPSKLKWTAQKVQLVELIYALKVCNVFNNGEIGIKELARNLEQLLGTKIGDIYRIFQEIRIRKKGRTVFLDSLREKLEGYMEEGDGM
ncbi:hypothetical protein DN752_04310 [Echinicola strongylocentroti]|uniref:Tetracycline regulation of excision, RteC n=1 Tax=Echinicola strongylocentroti TaxID=1795355 RepID=A0A2Z4IG11_9BACT|nr:RteC domain-containing protein [Echinicola strongylocentroti]AWW29428.1 hypothetical protein DN752_04310 [Echinicola strongylocentroti]